MQLNSSKQLWGEDEVGQKGWPTVRPISAGSAVVTVEAAANSNNMNERTLAKNHSNAMNVVTAVHKVDI